MVYLEENEEFKLYPNYSDISDDKDSGIKM